MVWRMVTLFLRDLWEHTNAFALVWTWVRKSFLVRNRATISIGDALPAKILRSPNPLPLPPMVCKWTFKYQLTSGWNGTIKCYKNRVLFQVINCISFDSSSYRKKHNKQKWKRQRKLAEMSVWYEKERKVRKVQLHQLSSKIMESPALELACSGRSDSG